MQVLRGDDPAGELLPSVRDDCIAAFLAFPAAGSIGRIRKLSAAQIQDQVPGTYGSFHFFKAFLIKTSAVKDIGGHNDVRSTGIQILCGIFRSDPAADLHAAGIGSKRG